MYLVILFWNAPKIKYSGKKASWYKVLTACYDFPKTGLNPLTKQQKWLQSIIAAG